MTTLLELSFIAIGASISIGAVIRPYRKYLRWKWFYDDFRSGDESKGGKTLFKEGRKRLIVAIIAIVGIILATIGSYV
jgi:hypothetical protein